VERLLRNASVADRPNPLRPGDTSNQKRAQELREKAGLLQKQAEQAAHSADTLMKSYNDALATLERAIAQALAEAQTSVAQRNTAEVDPKQLAVAANAPPEANRSGIPVPPPDPPSAPADREPPVAAQPPAASFGSSETQCRDVYGAPAREIPALAPATKAAAHSHDGFDMVIGYFDGKAAYFSFTKGNEPMVSTEIESLLKAHHGNADWKLVAGTPSPIDGRGLEEWTRSDGKARAELLHIEKRSVLSIYGEGY
jgi:hypothetical protein